MKPHILDLLYSYGHVDRRIHPLNMEDHNVTPIKRTKSLTTSSRPPDTSLCFLLIIVGPQHEGK